MQAVKLQKTYLCCFSSNPPKPNPYPAPKKHDQTGESRLSSRTIDKSSQGKELSLAEQTIYLKGLDWEGNPLTSRL